MCRLYTTFDVRCIYFESEIIVFLKHFLVIVFFNLYQFLSQLKR